MTSKEAFRFGFLYRCAEEGMTADAALDRARRGAEKAADFSPLGLLTGTAGTGLGLAKGLAGLGLAGMVAAPVLAGGAAGLGLAKAQERDIDPDEIRKQELIAAYNHHADQALRRRRPPGGPSR